MPEMYYGRGSYEMFDDYMDFINYVFSFNGNEEDFKKLLPKLYKEEYNPAGSSYVCTENGKLKAAIGAFDHDICVCGEYLKTRGIGNVAVHPYSRSKGYMRKLLNMAVDDMVKDGVVLSALGGRRQRYNYFSFDKLGSELSMSINSDNIRHTFGADRKPFFELVRVSENDTGLLAQIKELSEAQPLYALRAPDRYYSVLVSWRNAVLAVMRDGAFAGYFITSSDCVSELLVLPQYVDKLPELMADIYAKLGKSFRIKLPVYLSGYIRKIITLGEYYDLEPAKSFSVLNFEKVCLAFMKLKATYAPLPDGRLVLDIDGRGGHERIALEVKGGVPEVYATKADADLTLGHLEAMNLLFAPVWPARDELPEAARIWLPLPLFIYYADTV